MKYGILSIFLLIAGVLGYGYWHARTHGYLYLSIYDATAKSHYTPVKGLAIELLDGSGQLLAQGKSDMQYGSVHLQHPAVGSCSETEMQATASSQTRSAWQDCFKAQSTWIITWINEVRSVNINIGQCTLQKIPVSVRSFGDDWWLWWVPLPHVGGKPYSYYQIDLRIDPLKCAIVESRA